MSTLEVRYRRLLSLYPRRHRELYAEEMLGVLMEGAEPDRQKPSLEDRLDIAASAFVVWLRGSRDRLEDAAWRSAAHVVALFGAMFLFAIGARRLLIWAVSALTFPEGPLWYDPVNVARPIVWGLVTAALLAGLRRSATLLAIGGVAAEITRIAPLYRWSPSQVLGLSWIVALAATVAVACWWLARREPVTPRRPRGFRPYVAAVAVIVVGGAIDVGGGWWGQPTFPITPLFDSVYLVRAGAPAYLLVAALAGWAWWRQPGPVRRRTVVFAVPVVALVVLVTYGFAGFMYSSQRMPTPLPLSVVQWVMLALVPVLAFGVASLVLTRWERVIRLVRRGHEVEQREVAPER